MAYKLFYESIETQGNALSRITLVCSYSSLVLLYFLIASKQDQDDRSVKPPLAILDHAQILREVMSVYQSSFLGNEDEDEMDTGFRPWQGLDIMITPVATMCVSNGSQKEAVRPEWDDKVFVLSCLCYLQVWFLSFFSPSWFYSLKNTV